MNSHGTNSAESCLAAVCRPDWVSTSDLESRPGQNPRLMRPAGAKKSDSSETQKTEKILEEAGRLRTDASNCMSSFVMLASLL